MREFQWCDFTWDPRVFPDPEGMLARLKRRVCGSASGSTPTSPSAPRCSPRAGTSATFCAARTATSGSGTSGSPDGAGRLHQPGGPRVVRLEAGGAARPGVDCFKTDFGERVPLDVAWSDGTDPERMHNYYTYLYNRTVFDVLRKHRGEGEAVLFARSATAGSQSFPVHWGGDCESTYEAMAESLRGGLSLGCRASGTGAMTSAASRHPDPRAVQAVDRLRSAVLPQPSARVVVVPVPWLFDDESVDVLRAFTR
ncbi:TIM-barrel domain-containing protein [Streptomyces scabiei]|uniref:TIM-barrel domain-containing protein n=1 Tax=Streptomyces scabiei TaxID=1930 RepID=UPI003A934CC8